MKASGLVAGLVLAGLVAGCGGAGRGDPAPRVPAAGAATPGEARRRSPADPAALRVVSLNVYHGGIWSGWSGEDQELNVRLDMVTEELRALDPDVIGLQEASTGPRRGNVASRLAEALGYHAVRGPVIGRLFSWILRFSEGPAILSRYPIVAWEAHDLPRCESLWEPRVLVYAEIAAPGGPLPVFSTHTSGELCQSRRIAELVKERQRGRPAILVGDFNSVEGSGSIQALTAEAGFVDAFRSANPGTAGPTVWQNVRAPDPTVRRRVDFVFVAPGQAASATVVGSRLVVNTPRPRPDGRVLWPTDHYGVLADLDLRPARARAD